MEIYVLDQSFSSVEVIDMFESFLWVDRYNSFGDFEIFTLANKNILNVAQQDFYLWSPNSEHSMIIDERVITSDIESGNALTIRGRSLEFILDRRIVWFQTILNGNFQNAILRLLNENIINPLNPNRRISNFIFQASTDPRITSLTIKAQFTGDNLYTTIEELCKERQLGFKIVLNTNNQFVFSLYMGTDRSHSQQTNPYVVFSPNFDNIKNSNYFETNRILKTSALIAGEGEGSDRRTIEIGGGSDLARREQYIDARDISSKTQDRELTPDEYNAQLAQRGNERMAENIFIKTFDGDIEATQMYIHGRDFFLGDIVQIVNEFGIEASTRIVELISSNNNEGDNLVPTFSVIS